LSSALDGADVWALDTDNTLSVWRSRSKGFRREIEVRDFSSDRRGKPLQGNLIGIDFRPADNYLYGVTDTGAIYRIDTDAPGLGKAEFVSALAPRFAAGFQSLADFNPVANALRLIGSNDQNFAVVNANGGDLNLTVPQTTLAYAAGDINAAIDPAISGGAYSNNFPGAANTIFYAVDYDLDTLVTIAPLVAGGSSNTPGGQLQTIGQLTTRAGKVVNLSALADFDVYTDVDGNNHIIGLSWSVLFAIDLSQVVVPALGQQQPVPARFIALGGEQFVDIAVRPRTR
jgi:hypothetical protein